MTTEITKLVERFNSLDISNYGNDFLLTWDKTEQQLLATQLLTQIFSAMHKTGYSFKAFEGGLAISNFRDNSTRTRFSFASAANALGLTVSDLDEQKSQIAHGETVRETANMISFLAEAIGIRDDMYLGQGHTYQQEVANALDLGFSESTLHQRPALVNLQCDIDHPTQTMADLAKLRDYFGGLENLKGKKIAMTWAYSPSYGKPLSVPQGIIGLLSRYGMNVHLAYPKGYDLLPEVTQLAANQAQQSRGSFTISNSMEEAFADADIVYPKSWAPFKVMQQRTELLLNSDTQGLKELEKQCLANNANYVNWECDRAKMNLTAGGKALYMHCLPADITDVSCKQGEVSAEVFEQYRAHTYHQAGFKPFVIAAMIFLARFVNPQTKLESIIRRGLRNH